jgi:hypothetical protein
LRHFGLDLVEGPDGPVAFRLLNRSIIRSRFASPGFFFAPLSHFELCDWHPHFLPFASTVVHFVLCLCPHLTHLFMPLHSWPFGDMPWLKILVRRNIVQPVLAISQNQEISG